MKNIEKITLSVTYILNCIHNLINCHTNRAIIDKCRCACYSINVVKKTTP